MNKSSDFNHFLDESSWSQELEPYQRQILNTVLDTIKLLPPSYINDLADIGCGNGLMAALIGQEIGCRATGVDAYIPENRENFVPIITWDALKPLNHALTNQPDAIISIDMLEHLIPSECQQAVHNIFKTSTKFVAIGVPYKEPLALSYVACQSCGHYYHNVGHLQSFCLDDVVKLVPLDWSITHAVITGDQWPRVSTEEMHSLLNNKLTHSSATSICPNCGLKQQQSSEQIECASSILLDLNDRTHSISSLPYSLGTELILFCNRTLDHQASAPLSLVDTARSSSSVNVSTIPTANCLARYPTHITRVESTCGNILIQSPSKFALLLQARAALRLAKTNPRLLRHSLQVSAKRSSLYGYVLSLPSQLVNNVRLYGRSLCYHKSNAYYELESPYSFPLLWRAPRDYLLTCRPKL